MIFLIVFISITQWLLQYSIYDTVGCKGLIIFFLKDKIMPLSQASFIGGYGVSAFVLVKVKIHNSKAMGSPTTDKP